MAIDTSKIQGRRVLRFESIDQILADAEASVRSPRLRVLGNWSPGQIFSHVAIGMEMALDGSDLKAPLPVRMVARWLRRRFLHKPMAAGFRLNRRMSDAIVPQASTTTEDGLARLRSTVARWKAEPQRRPHFVLGTLTPHEWDLLTQRHAELHLSFLIPESDHRTAS